MVKYWLKILYKQLRVKADLFLEFNLFFSIMRMETSIFTLLLNFNLTEMAGFQIYIYIYMHTYTHTYILVKFCNLLLNLIINLGYPFM